VDDISCQDLVELVTAYLDGVLTVAMTQRFEAHIAGCLGCETYLDQIRRTVGALSQLSGDPLTGARRDALMAALRARTATGSAHG
jgi:anti-sigma factor RsiW